MWIPKSEQEIIEALNNNDIIENPILDVKKEVSLKSIDIATDIAAMANDGGIIIYGIEEDENGFPAIANPITLKGQPERIDQIVRSSISETPQIRISTIESKKGPDFGYIVVQIPPSDRAPHMVVVKGENRFYGRSEKGNIILTEGEIARLYERRQKTEIDREKLLENELKQTSFQPVDGLAYLYLLAKPVIKKDELIKPIINDENFRGEFIHLIDSTISKNDFENRNVLPFINATSWKYLHNGYEGILQESANPKDERAPSHYLSLKIDFDGMVHLFFGRAADIDTGGVKFFFPQNVTEITLFFLCFIKEFYLKIHYLGSFDVGLGLTGLKDSIPYTKNPFFFDVFSRYNLDKYTRTLRVPLLDEDVLDSILQVCDKLLSQLFNATSQGRINPIRDQIKIYKTQK